LKHSEIASANLLPEGIIELIFLQENVTLTKGDVSTGWAMAESLDKNKNTPVLLKTGAWTLLDQDAREFAINEMKLWPRVSVLVHNLGQKLLGTVAIKWMGQSSSIKLFESEKEALNWLKDIKKL
jgi:hypothetical protein